VEELALTGGRVTGGVVRVGETVRRPPRANAALVRRLLTVLEELGLMIAPRYLGVDGQGRETLSYLDGDVPEELDASFSDETLGHGARLIRSFHDATAESSLAGGREVVCHGDLSPCNFVFRNGKPVALIDFDNAAPGRRLDDVGYALFLWLNLGTDGPAPVEQARRVAVFCKAYGMPVGPKISAVISSAVAANIERLRVEGRFDDLEWWQTQLAWLVEHSAALTPA
jgi:Phosphotransferase enzyme family